MAQKAPQPTKDEVVSAYRRDQILTAAHGVFASRGFRQATVGDIAEAAGIAKGTLYLYFKSKDDIYWAAMNRGLDGLQALTTAALERVNHPREKLRAFIETKVRFFDADRDFFSIYFAEFGNVSPHHLPAQQPFLQRYMEQVDLLDRTLQDAAGAGLIRQSALNGLGYSVMAVTASVIARRLRGWSRNSLEEDVTTAVDLLWKGLAESSHA
jgi:AcrR family transcriptional regulator